MPVTQLTQEMFNLIGRYETERDATIQRVALSHNAGIADMNPVRQLHSRYIQEAISIVIRAWGNVVDTNGIQTLGDGEAWRNIGSATRAYEASKSTLAKSAMSDSEYMRAKDRAKSLMISASNQTHDFIQIYRDAEENVRIIFQEARGELLAHKGLEWHSIHTMLENDRRKRTHSEGMNQALKRRVKIAQEVYTCYEATRAIFQYFGGWNGDIAPLNIAGALQRRGIDPIAAGVGRAFPSQMAMDSSDYLTKVDRFIRIEKTSVEIDNVTGINDYHFMKGDSSFNRVSNW